MRSAKVLIVAFAILPPVGCNLFAGYYTKPQHFRFATADQREIKHSVDHTVKSIKLVLDEYGYGLTGVEQPNADVARITASKNGLEYWFDIKSTGESSCLIHAEINQAGNSTELSELLRKIELMP